MQTGPNLSQPISSVASRLIECKLLTAPLAIPFLPQPALGRIAQIQKLFGAPVGWHPSRRITASAVGVGGGHDLGASVLDLGEDVELVVPARDDVVTAAEFVDGGGGVGVFLLALLEGCEELGGGGQGEEGCEGEVEEAHGVVWGLRCRQDLFGSVGVVEWMEVRPLEVEWTER